MGKEIERKFLVHEDILKPLLVQGYAIKQGYVETSGDMKVKLDIDDDNEIAWIKIEGKEFKIFKIPYKEALEISELLATDDNEIIANTKTVVRARIKGDEGFLTIKGENEGAVRTEFEYDIQADDAIDIIENYCTEDNIIEKVRYEIKKSIHIWEVDVFTGLNEGLIVAEIELKSENEIFEKEDWVTIEVTDDNKYYNSNLMKNPYTKW